MTLVKLIIGLFIILVTLGSMLAFVYTGEINYGVWVIILMLVLNDFENNK